jgi:hypothetical protein
MWCYDYMLWFCGLDWLVWEHLTGQWCVRVAKIMNVSVPQDKDFFSCWITVYSLRKTRELRWILSSRAVTMKRRSAIFQDVTLYSTTEIHQRFGRTYCLHLQGPSVAKILLLLASYWLLSCLNYSLILQDYTASHPRRYCTESYVVDYFRDMYLWHNTGAIHCIHRLFVRQGTIFLDEFSGDIERKVNERFWTKN